MKRLYRALAMLLFASLAFQACGPDISQEEQQRRKAAEKTLSYLKDDIMKYYYYWNTAVPDLDYTYDTDVYDFFDDLLWEGDRWSWMMDGQDYMERESGIVSGSYGASFAQPIIDPTLYFGKDYNIMVRYVYPDSPFDKAGVKRGWTITAIDDIPTLDYYLTPENVSKEEINARAKVFTDMLTKPSTTQGRKFTFLTGEGETVVKNIVAATTINTRPTLVKKIFTSEDYTESRLFPLSGVYGRG